MESFQLGEKVGESNEMLLYSELYFVTMQEVLAFRVSYFEVWRSASR